MKKPTILKTLSQKVIAGILILAAVGLAGYWLSGQLTEAAGTPTITSATDSPDPVTEGSNITFSVDWADSDGDGVKTYICKTDAITSGTGSLSNLVSMTLYYVRAYVHTSEGYVYGNEISFITNAVLSDIISGVSTRLRGGTTIRGGSTIR